MNLITTAVGVTLAVIAANSYAQQDPPTAPAEGALSDAGVKEIVDRLNLLQREIDRLTDASRVETSSVVRCNQVAPGFAIEKSAHAFNVLYRGHLVYSLAGSRLRNDVFGGKEPYLECEQGLSSAEMFAMVLGWKRDLLMAFGVVREGGEVVGVTKVEWFPHDSEFSPIVLHPGNEYTARFGWKRDLNVRVCWNATGNNEWTFSRNHRVAAAQPCSTAKAPYGASQVLIPIRSVAALVEE